MRKSNYGCGDGGGWEKVLKETVYGGSGCGRPGRTGRSAGMGCAEGSGQRILAL